MTIIIISLNAHGLNSPYKRKAMWQEAKNLKRDVICIQETHFSATKPPKCTHKLFPHIFTANANVKKKRNLDSDKELCLFYTPFLDTRQ